MEEQEQGQKAIYSVNEYRDFIQALLTPEIVDVINQVIAENSGGKVRLYSLDKEFDAKAMSGYVATTLNHLNVKPNQNVEDIDRHQFRAHLQAVVKNELANAV